MSHYPLVEVAGSARARGEQYGRAVAGRIRRSVERYAALYAYHARIDWAAACERARAYVEPIEAYDPRYLQELEGIAAGSGLSLLDLVALNIRTEIINSARVLGLAPTVAGPAECTSLGARRADGDVIVGQNWDYYAHCRQTVVVLAAVPDDGPSFVTVVEAGLLAKAGMNAAGLALVTNGIATVHDDGTPGVPYHVLLRALLEADSLAAARTALVRAPRRAATGNYLLGTAAGDLVDVEAWAGPTDTVPTVDAPAEADGLLRHANHCVAVPPERAGEPRELTDTSVFRADRVAAAARAGGGEVWVADLQRALSDHVGYPHSVCTHEDPDLPELERCPTCLSLIMVPSTRELLLADGNPCVVPYRRLDTAILT
ncbi:MAG: C45 family autoproteolytic acyltransferase/hydrolase [Conexibacter sp.]